MWRDAVALTDFNYALQVNPDNLTALYHRGETYKQMEQRHKAAIDFHAYIQREVDPRPALDQAGVA
jgi:regulator of sirC expression with transglutaminase-like and TPR domain